MRVIVIIPAFNEEKSIARVLNAIPKKLVEEIIVVDNNSTDKTAQIARKHGATVVQENRRGYGQACLAGIKYAKSRNPETVVFLDADYSDHPEEMPGLLQKIEESHDLVIGSRILGQAEPGALLPQARFGNWLSVFLINLLFGFKYTDLGPFRAIKWPQLLRLNMQDTNFGWTVEMQVKAAKMGFKITEVPVSYRSRIGVSKITGTVAGTLMAGYKILSTIFKQALKK
ncbi:MAG: glycosyltransferase family 2 protein [bacterium]